MANDVRIATNDWRRRGRFAAQMKPTYAKIERTPDDGIELLSIRTRNVERACTFLREEANTTKLTAPKHIFPHRNRHPNGVRMPPSGKRA